MITIETLKIFKKYDGQIDDWSKSKKDFDKDYMNAENWYLINNYIQDLQLINNNKASLEYVNRLKNSIKLNIENNEVFIYLLKLSKVKSSIFNDWNFEK
jgi:hypothetical protein